MRRTARMSPEWGFPHCKIFLPGWDHPHLQVIIFSSSHSPLRISSCTRVRHIVGRVFCFHPRVQLCFCRPCHLYRALVRSQKVPSNLLIEYLNDCLTWNIKVVHSSTAWGWNFLIEFNKSWTDGEHLARWTLSHSKHSVRAKIWSGSLDFTSNGVELPPCGHPACRQTQQVSTCSWLQPLEQSIE